MEAIYVDWWMCDRINELYPTKKIHENLYRIRWYNRFIQFATAYEKSLHGLHYEMCADGYLKLHFEGKFSAQRAEVSQYLYSKTHDDERYLWYSNDVYELGICKFDVFIQNRETFESAIHTFVETIDTLLLHYKKCINVQMDDVEYDTSIIHKLTHMSSDDDVCLIDNLSLSDILHMNINIPEYQRIYCWDEKNVRRLLDDLTDFGGTYRLGTIILHYHEDVFDIIDGQQRLVTLSLILRKLGYAHSPLLNLCFQSSEAIDYVAYNRHVIDSYINMHINANRQDFAEKILKSLEFSVLIIHSSNIDLAYTFFSNENSRGKSLSDFDLLKAHHLRYVTDDTQAEHLAKGWDRMLSLANKEYEFNIDKPYYRALGLYVFRLRHWMYNEKWDDFAPYKIKYEYEAAPIIDEIPPFGEHFLFNETIQGGSHFFAFVKQFEYRYLLFSQTEEFKSIHKVDGRTHWWFRDVIESLLFAYYLKFGNEYLSEVLIGISRIVMQFRFDYAKADYGRILRQAGDSGILSMIDRSTSPTFVLAELKRKINTLPTVLTNLKPIANEFQHLLKANLLGIKKNHVVINEFKRLL